MHVFRPAVLLSACALAVLVDGCSPLGERGGLASGGRRGVYRERGALVLGGPTLQGGRGSLLDALRGRIPSFRLSRAAGRCPRISLRGTGATVGRLGNPSVYVDGTHATDTCILEALRANDTQRVEVYPMGFTTRPGYGTESNGLILVFMRSR